MSELNDLQKALGEWGNATFPNSDAGTICDHLAEKMIELLGTERVAEAYMRAREKALIYASPEMYITDVHTCPAEDPAAESADCLLLLLHLAHRLGYSLDTAVRAKFEVCKGRTWDSGEGRGYSRHVEEPAGVRASAGEAGAEGEGGGTT